MRPRRDVCPFCRPRTRVQDVYSLTSIADFADGTGPLVNGTAATQVVLGSTGWTPPAVTGSRGGNPALASLISALAGVGLVADHTT